MTYFTYRLYFCLVYLLQRWYDPLEKKRVLICSDDMLIDFYIVDADCLIHYDIPANKHNFSMRFSVLQNSSNVVNKVSSLKLFKKTVKLFLFIKNANM